MGSSTPSVPRVGSPLAQSTLEDAGQPTLLSPLLTTHPLLLHNSLHLAFLNLRFPFFEMPTWEAK